MPPGRAGGDEPELEGAVLSRGSDLGSAGGGGEGDNGGGRPGYRAAAAAVDAELLHARRWRRWPRAGWLAAALAIRAF